jgi:hypothetical protein
MAEYTLQLLHNQQYAGQQPHAEHDQASQQK